MTYALAKSPCAANSDFELAEECEIDVQAIVGGAIERPRGGSRRTAAGVDRVIEQAKVRRGVLVAMLRENCRPGVFGVAEHVRDKLPGLVGGRAGFHRLLGRRSATATEQSHDQPRIDAEKICTNDGDEAHDAELHAATTARRPSAVVLDVLTRSGLSPTHAANVSTGPHGMIPALVRSGLPIDEILPALSAVFARHRNAVVEAPPGAGKSTVVPIALLDEPWLRGGKIIMLEPRRLATRAVAARMASTLGESPGETVGYRMRQETRVGKRTRIEVVTEGVFTRMLQSDPALEGVAAVLFDEFHERSLHADTGLAFALDSQENLSPELKLLVMSATLDGAAVAELLGDAPVVTAAGRVHPVAIQYAGTGLPLLPGGRDSPELAVLRVIKRALTEAPGDMLVFLPGSGRNPASAGHVERHRQ